MIAVCVKASASTRRRALSTLSDSLRRRRTILCDDASSSKNSCSYFQGATIHQMTAAKPSHLGCRNRTNTPTTFRSISSTPVRHDGELAERCDRNIVSSPFEPIDPESSWGQKPLPDFVMEKWKEHPDDLAIFDGSTGASRTFSDHYQDAAGIAGSLRHEMGINDESGRSCVCLFAPNHVDYLPVTLAVGLCGAKLTPVNPLYKANELQIVLDKSQSSVLIAHESKIAVALEAASNVQCVKHVLVMTQDGEGGLPGGLERLESIKRHPHSFDTTADAVHSAATTHPYLMPYSSGTTGLPKGVCLSHANLTANLLQIEVVEKSRWKRTDGLFSPLPFFHIYGMTASMMYCGWKRSPIYTMSGKFDLELMLEMIQDHRPATAHLVPPIILALAKSPLVDQYDLSSLQTIMSGASPLGADTERAVQNRIGCQVKQAWGMSELSPIGTFSPSSNIKEGSVGPVVSNTLGKIIDGNGKSLGPNQDGELIIKGPQVMMEYHNEPEKTKECLSSSGWLRTGDLAYYDEDGYFYITDRIKELIKVRGYQVAPAELEEMLLSHNDVNDVAVIQIPDERSGELPLAYIVLKDGCDAKDDPETIKSNIYEWVKERVAPYKRIDGGIIFVDSIPKSASGKILRRILRDELAEQMKA